MHNIGRVPHIDYVCVKAIPKSNALMKLYGIKCIILVLVIYKGPGCIEAGRGPHMD